MFLFDNDSRADDSCNDARQNGEMCWLEAVAAFLKASALQPGYHQVAGRDRQPRQSRFGGCVSALNGDRQCTSPAAARDG